MIAINDLGLRHSTPCRGSVAYPSGTPGTWVHQPAEGTGHTGEERTFGDSHTLVVATTEDTSTKWQEQVRGLPGVTGMESPYAPVC